MKRYVAMLRTDADDRDITETALKETGIDVPLRFIADMDELESIIKESGEPSLVLLNDNDAAHKGYEKIVQLKSNDLYSHIPLIVLAEVSTDEYVKKCYKAGANSFITKPSTIAATNKKISGFFDYWFNVAEL
ncbi:MAG TPA: response regulator [Chitinophagaceae bacterium]